MDVSNVTTPVLQLVSSRNIITSRQGREGIPVRSAISHSLDYNHLRRHRFTHTGEPYKCQQSDHSCTTASDLQKHWITHTGE